MDGKAVPGVVLMVRYVRCDSQKFQGYVDYIDRDEAIRNATFHQYSAFVDDYMDDPAKQKERFGFNVQSDKTGALFTAGRDTLSPAEKAALKKEFQTAQENGSYLWQNVISFDNGWLERQGMYDRATGWLDDLRVRELTRNAMDVMLRREGMEFSAVWSASIHFNTDNIHIHIAVAEPHPTREKMQYRGEEVYRSKLKQSTLDAMKSKAVNTVVDRSELHRRVNGLLRDNILAEAKSHPFLKDESFREDYLKLYRSLPKDRRMWQYGKNGLKIHPCWTPLLNGIWNGTTRRN